MAEPPEVEGPTIEETVAGLSRTVVILQRLMWFAAFIIGAMLVYLLVLQFQVSDMNGQLDDIKGQTDKIGGFVDELQNERAQQDEGVTTEELRAVFKHITDTLTLLCNEYPDDPVCMQG